MTGARCLSVPAITRRELMPLTEEYAKVTGIPYLMDAYREEALPVLNSRTLCLACLRNERAPAYRRPFYLDGSSIDSST